MISGYYAYILLYYIIVAIFIRLFLFNRFAHTAGPGLEKNAVTVWPHQRRKGSWTSTPVGPKRSPTGQISPPRGSSGVLLGRLGRQVGLRRALWAKKRSLKIVWRALGTILGSSWRVLGPFWVAFPAP